MAIQFRCPSGHRLSAADDRAGRRVRCPKCAAEVQIPAAEPAARQAVTAGLDAAATAAVPSTANSGAAKTAGRRDRLAGPPQAAPPQPAAASALKPNDVTVSTAKPAARPPLPPRKSTREAPPTIATPARPPAASRPAVANEAVTAAKSAPVVKSAQVVKSAPAAASVPTKVLAPRRRGYRPNDDKRHTVYFLGMGLLLLVAFHAAPALKHFEAGLSPLWVQAVLWLVVVELAYVAWMMLVPDWSTVWTTMIVFAIVAAIYGAALALTVMTPRGAPMLLDLDEKRDAARLWCGSVILLTGLMTYIAGSIGYKWRKAYRLGA